MKLVVGGAYQGKLAYAKEAYRTDSGWIDGTTCSLDGAIDTCRGIYHFHDYVKRLLQSGQLQENKDNLIDMEQWAAAFAEELCRRNPDILIVSNELGYGIVPMEKFDRQWRELVGRLCTCLAKQSEEVVRVVCGVGMRLK